MYESARHVTCSASAGDDAFEDGKYFVLTLTDVMMVKGVQGDHGPSVPSSARSAHSPARIHGQAVAKPSLMNESTPRPTIQCVYVRENQSDQIVDPPF